MLHKICYIYPFLYDDHRESLVEFPLNHLLCGWLVQNSVVEYGNSLVWLHTMLSSGGHQVEIG